MQYFSGKYVILPNPNRITKLSRQLTNNQRVALFICINFPHICPTSQHFCRNVLGTLPSEQKRSEKIQNCFINWKFASFYHFD